jgi:hypothetical protein
VVPEAVASSFVAFQTTVFLLRRKNPVIFDRGGSVDGEYQSLPDSLVTPIKNRAQRTVRTSDLMGVNQLLYQTELVAHVLPQDCCNMQKLHITTILLHRVPGEI